MAGKMSHCLGYCVCALVLTAVPLAWGSVNTQDICNRDPPDTAASQTPGDNGFQIKIVGRPQPERYSPDQVYTIVINGTYPNQKLLGFMLVAVTLNAQDESTMLGNYQHMSSGTTRFADDCPHVVTHTYAHPKAGVEVLWTAPPKGTGCIEFRATVIEYTDIWYKDDGALTRVFCEETGTTENNQSPEMLPECCACGTAKYQMTFEGTWSRRSHPKDFPTMKSLLHWSNIVGASHSKHYAIWQYGGVASKGVKEVCEYGFTRALEQEIREHSRDVRTVLKTLGIWWSEAHGLEQTRWARFSVDRRNHLVSMLTMLGPSPDWCVGVSALNLCLPNCSWTGDMELKLYPWDAGTDDGVTYMAPNKPSNPPQKIHRITNSFPHSLDSPFYDEDPIEPLAMLKIRRIHPKTGSMSPAVCTAEAEVSSEDSIEESEDLIDEAERKRKMMEGQGKCAVSEWAEWSECSVTCGVGQRFRKRMFLHAGVDEIMCSLETMESENCIGIENECEGLSDECAVSRWSEWSPCSVTCGKGTRDRQRFYYRQEDMKTCNRKLEEKEVCMGEVPDCSNALAMLNFTAICSEPVSYGRCRDEFSRFYFDTIMNKCLPFTFTGCRGNRNNFMTMDECSDMCFPLVKQAMMEQQQQQPGEATSSKEVVQEDDPSTICLLDSDGGPCRAHYTRYYFHRDMLKCLPFTYGGCQGNANNFVTEESCMDMCMPVMKQEMMKRKLNAEQGNNHNNSSASNNRQTKKQGGGGGGGGGNRHDPSQGPRVDCMVTDWTDWTECTVTCGRGYKHKRRMVKRPADNGGRKCPKKLERKKRCKMPKCQSSSHQQQAKAHKGQGQSNSNARRKGDRERKRDQNSRGDRKKPKGERRKGNEETEQKGSQAKGHRRLSRKGDRSRQKGDVEGPAEVTTTSAPRRQAQKQDKKRAGSKGQGRGGKGQQGGSRNVNKKNNRRKGGSEPSGPKGGRNRKGESQAREQTSEPSNVRHRAKGNQGNRKAQETTTAMITTTAQAPGNQRKPKKKKNKSSEDIVDSTQIPASDAGRRVRDCEITSWSQWSHCSVTCGRGFQYKRRTILNEEKNGGKPCPKKLEIKQRCTMLKCPGEQCQMSDWGPWTPCPKTCGSGSIQERTRHIVSSPNNDVSVCGQRIERRYCTLPPCPNQNGSWVEVHHCSYTILPISEYEGMSLSHKKHHRRRHRSLN